MKTIAGKVTAYALVRDKNGKPSFSDINNIPKIYWDLLTDKEKEVIQDGSNTLRRNT